MPDQPGSAPSKRVSAKDVLAHRIAVYGKTKPIRHEHVVRRALRLLARVEDGAAQLDRWADASEDHSGYHDCMGMDCLGAGQDTADFLRDLAALVAPTDAEGKA